MKLRHLVSVGCACALAACGESSAVDAGAPAAKLVVDAGPPRKAIAQLEAAGAGVTLARDGATGPARVGPLYLKDVIETGPNAKASVRFPDGHTLELEPDGHYELGGDGEAFALTIGEGSILSSGGEGATGDVQLTILTPYGLVRLGKGDATVGLEGGDVNVDVRTGEISILKRNADGSFTVVAGAVTAGKKVSLDKNGLKPLVLDAIQIDLIASNGRVEVRVKDGKFLNVNPRKLPTLKEGDAIRVTVGSATMGVKDSKARLTARAGTEVAVLSAKKNGDTEELGLDLRKGALDVAMPVGTKHTLTPGDGYKLTAANGGQFSLVKSKTGLELNTVVGDVLVEHEGSAPVTISSGQAGSFNKASGKAAVKETPRETISFSSRGNQRVFHPGIGTVSIGWPGEPDKNYQIVVANDPLLQSPIIDGIVHHPWFNVPLPNKGVVAWKVLDGKTEVARGSISAAPERVGQEMGTNINEVPFGAEATRIYYQDKPPSVTFMWKPVEDLPVAEYAVRVYKDGSFSVPIEEQKTKTTRLQLPERALGEGKYRWSVVPLGADGKQLRGGSMSVLEMIYDNNVSELTITSPKNGDPLRPKVAAIGIAPLRTKVAVNGQTLALDEKARFNTQVAPLPGGRVVFRTFGGDGGEQFIVRVLRK